MIKNIYYQQVNLIQHNQQENMNLFSFAHQRLESGHRSLRQALRQDDLGDDAASVFRVAREPAGRSGDFASYRERSVPVENRIGALTRTTHPPNGFAPDARTTSGRFRSVFLCAPNTLGRYGKVHKVPVPSYAVEAARVPCQECQIGREDHHRSSSEEKGVGGHPRRVQVL